MVGAQPPQTVQNESLNKLLSQTDVSSLTPEQKQNLKIAFAEGYLAANSPDNAKKNGKAMKALKVKIRGINRMIFSIPLKCKPGSVKIA